MKKGLAWIQSHRAAVLFFLKHHKKMCAMLRTILVLILAMFIAPYFIGLTEQIKNYYEYKDSFILASVAVAALHHLLEKLGDTLE